MRTWEAQIRHDDPLAVLHAADVRLEDCVEEEEDEQTEERDDSHEHAEVAGIGVAVVQTFVRIWIPAFARDTPKHDDRKELQKKNRAHPLRQINDFAN